MQEKIVTYRADELPPLSAESERLYKEAIAKPDSEIDLSDIPEWT
jgi:hypothetical protein